MGRQRRQLIGADSGGGLSDVDVGAMGCQYDSFKFVERYVRGDTASRGLASDEAVPGFGALSDNVHGVARDISSAVNLKSCVGLTNLLFLHSPVKANWFSGLPSGIL